MIVRKVNTEERAKQMVSIASVMGIDSSYVQDKNNSRWFVVSFDCTDYQFQFLNKRLKKEITK